jgi:hypothetical protein
MGIRRINISLGTPLGAKNFKNFINPCLKIAIIVTAIKMKKEMANVTII